MFFYLLTTILLIAFLEKLVPDIVLTVQRDKEFKTGRYGSCFSGKAITSYFVANKKNDTLAGFLILCVEKMAFSLGQSTTLKSHFFYSQNQCKDFRFQYQVAKNHLTLKRKVIGNLWT